MKFILTTGGTAGHINPAIAVAEYLKTKGHDVLFAGTPNRLESRLVPEAGFDFKGFDAKGFNRRKPWTLVSSISSIISSTSNTKKWLLEQKPDAVMGFGCYVSLSICRAAKQLKIPYLIHEQNSVMGMANKYLTKSAYATCLTYEHADTGKCHNVQITGNPVRRTIFDAKKEDGRAMLDIPMDAKVLLVFGGSLGAKHINNEMTKIASNLLGRKNLYIVHITGNKEYENVVNSLELENEKSQRYKILPYQNKMGETMAAADVCISRAGASTLAELTARALPALLVPYPYATENHQFYNAQTLLDAGCAMYINDENVSSPEFMKAVEKLIDDDDLSEQMHEAYAQFDAQNAVVRLSNLLENVK